MAYGSKMKNKPKAPKGYHYMPNGKLMKDSDMKKKPVKKTMKKPVKKKK